MKIVITGCAGFIGLNFTRYLLDKYPNYKIVAIDALTYAANQDEFFTLLKSYDRISFYHTSICDSEKIMRIFKYEKPDCVVNFAAETHVDRSIESADKFVKTNVLGTQVLLDACLELGGIRFHQISTDEVYGALAIDSPDAFSETSALLPSSPYSASKAAADLLALAYYKTHSLPVTVSRCANNYGPYQNPEKLIPKCVQCLAFGKKIPIYGDGKNVREWISVSDHCIAVDTIIHNGTIGEIYNVGGGVELSNVELVGKIIRIYHELLLSEIDSHHTESGTDLKSSKNNSAQISALEITDNIEFVADRKGHDTRYSLNSEKLKTSLGWTPVSSFDDEIRNTVKWFKDKFDL